MAAVGSLPRGPIERAQAGHPGRRKHRVPKQSPDLYALLGVGRGASADQLRKAYDWCMSTRQPPERRAGVQRAYAILGDPRLRAQYDAGHVVGVGAGAYYQANTHASGGSRKVGTGYSGSTSPLEQRWQTRWSARPQACLPARPGRAIAVALAVGLLLSLAAGVGAGRWPEVQAAVASVASGHSPVASERTAGQSGPHDFATGSCYSSGPGRELQAAHPLSCDSPHLYEVIKVIDLNRLLGRPADDEVQQAAQDVCGHEFAAYTGLAGPTADLWPTWVTTTAAPPGPAWATCLVGSRTPRTASALATGH
jgi:hypothetical protein